MDGSPALIWRSGSKAHALELLLVVRGPWPTISATVLPQTLAHPQACAWVSQWIWRMEIVQLRQDPASPSCRWVGAFG